MNRFAIAALMLAVLTACTDDGSARSGGPNDMPRSMMDAEVRGMAADPARLNTQLNLCRSQLRSSTSQHRQNMAKAMGISPDQVPQVFCDRIVRGLASGRITTRQFQQASKGNMGPEVAAVILGL